MLPQVN